MNATRRWLIALLLSLTPAATAAASDAQNFFFLLKDSHTFFELANETGATVEGYAYDGYGGVTVSRAALNVVAVGPRYLAVTPRVGDTLVALRVTSPDWPCLNKYVGMDGVLQSSPHFQVPTAWGTVYVRGQDIVADTAYDVQTDDGATLSTLGRARTWHWADVNNDGFANVADVLCILDRFAGLPGGCSRQATDLLGTTPNAFTNVDDALAALDAFAGLGYPGPDPCAAGDPGLAGNARVASNLAPTQSGLVSTLAQTPNPFYFTGQRLDAFDPPDPALPPAPDNAGLLLYDYKARAFDPRHGRFLQRDPAEFAVGYNLYEYVASRPTLFTDPTGEFEFSLGGLLNNTTISKGLTAFNAASNAKTVLDAARQLAAGATLQGVFVSLAIEYATDKLGGKIFDQLTDALRLLKGKFAKGLFKGRLGGAAHRATVTATAGKLKDEGFTVVSEAFFRNTAGGKNRFADLVAFNKATGELQIIQVGDVDKLLGIPIDRELDALSDILFSSEAGGQLLRRLNTAGFGLDDVTSVAIRFIQKP